MSESTTNQATDPKPMTRPEDAYNLGGRVETALSATDPLSKAIEFLVEDVVDARANVSAEAIRRISSLRKQEKQIVGKSPGKLDDGTDAPRILSPESARLKQGFIDEAMKISTLLSAALNEGRWTALAKHLSMTELNTVPFFAPPDDDGCDCRC